LFGYLDGTIVEPEKMASTHAMWVAQDQQVMGFINASLSREVLGHVATCATTVAAWKEINYMFYSQSRAWTIQLRTCLATTRKGNLSAAAYYAKMKAFAGEMSAAGKPLEDEDFVTYVLAGLDQNYNSVVESIIGKESSPWDLFIPSFLSLRPGLIYKALTPRRQWMLLQGVVVLTMAVVDVMEEEEALVMVLEAIEKRVPLQEPNQCASSVKRLDTLSWDVGSGLTATTREKKGWPTVLKVTCTMLI
jgi:hypothetical protein